MPTIIAFHPLGYEVHFEVELADIPKMVSRLEGGGINPGANWFLPLKGCLFALAMA